MTKKSEEIMEILEAYDLTRCAASAAELSGADRKTVQRYVGLRDAGQDPSERTRRSQLIDPYLDKVEELVEDSKGRVRADIVHDRLRAMGYEGSERTTRRAAQHAKARYGGPGDQGWLGVDGPGGEGRPGAHRAQPAPGV